MVGGRFIDCQEAGAPRLESGRGKKTNKKQKRNQEKIKQSQPKPFGRRETGQSGRKVVGPADGNRATLFLFRRFLRFWLDRLSLGLQPWNRHFEVFVFVYSLFFGVATLGWFSFFFVTGFIRWLSRPFNCVSIVDCAPTPASGADRPASAPPPSGRADVSARPVNDYRAGRSAGEAVCPAHHPLMIIYESFIKKSTFPKPLEPSEVKKKQE